MYLNMSRLNALIYFLLCLRLTIEAESGNKTSDIHQLIKEEKDLSTKIKEIVVSNTSNSTTAGEGSDKTSLTNDHVNVSVHKDQLKPLDNVTVGETRLPGNAETMNFGALIRGFYVFLGLSVIVIMYFTVRAIRLGRKRTKVKKYGILANREDLEMAPLGAEDDEEDTTVFDLSSHSGH